MKHLLRTLLLLSVMLFTISCVTKKKKDEDVSKLGLFYHNTTAKFNGYFNANVLLNESIANLNEQHVDNYNQILDMYPYIAADNPQSVAEQLDEATKKVSIVVSLHRPSHWTDDCYMLIGKAQFLKQNYEDAEETLEYFRENFDPSTVKSKKKGKQKKASSKKERTKKAAKASKERAKTKKQLAKERKKYNKQVRKNKKKRGNKKSTSRPSRAKTEEIKTVEAPTPPASQPEPEQEETVSSNSSADNDSYFLKHKPVYQEGMLWLAKVYIERESYTDAESILSSLERNPNTFEEIQIELDGIRAYMLIKQKQYDSAIPYLEKAAAKTKDRSQKARFTYILAQLHQNAGRGAQAYAYFEEALKASTSYEMEFSARLNLVRNGWVTKESSSEETIKELSKMLKDIKNEEYRDQIYYAMAEIALKDGDRMAAKENLKLSLASSLSASPQRTESYLQLADLYFEDQQYVEAKSYFDSTLQVMPQTDSRYNRVSNFSNNLTDIAKNITIILEQDSLLRISAMSDKEKQALAYDIMKSQEEADRLKLLNAANNQSFDPKSNKPNNRFQSAGPATAPSTFFAYDERRVKKGKKDFEKNWGSRSLEDNWRRSNRRGLGEEIAEAVEDEKISRQVTDEDVEKLLKDVPTTPEAIAAANKKIEKALFELGSLYRARLENNPKSIETLEELMRRYPDTEHQLDAWYNLYLAYTDTNNKSKAKEYYDMIVKNHPNTTYARVLQDPNFLEASKEEERRLMAYYDETYNAFQQGQYPVAIDRIAKVDELFGNQNTMQPKFALLSALSIGNIKGKDAYIAALQDLIAQYPTTDEATRAKEILRLLTGANVSAGGIGEEDGAPEEETNFKLEDDKIHYFIVVLDGTSINLEEAKVAVSDYNRTYYNLDKLRISNIYLGANTNTPILVIRRFKNKGDSMKYYDSITKNKSDFLPAGAKYEFYPVTQNNYREILKSKTMDSYRPFFQQNYFN